MSIHWKTQKRLQLFSGVIDEHIPGDLIPHSEIEEVLRKFETTEPSRWDRVIGQLVTHYNESLNSKFGKLEPMLGKVKVLEGAVSQFQERMRKASAEKTAIASYLLYWLFDQKIESGDEEVEQETAIENFSKGALYECKVNWDEGGSIDARLKMKRRILKNRTLMSLLIDAGTSNIRVAKEFLASKNLPLIVKTAHGVRKVTPSIITNSLSIASSISEHEDRRNLWLTLIGGRENPVRRSLIGEMALSWAKGIRSRGKIDLSIIGATGITSNESGLMSVYMDDEVECELKAEFLQMANFRVVVCDSSKILMGSCINEFAALTQANIDLVITDGGECLWRAKGSPFFGSEKFVRDEIEGFMKQAAEAGVGVIAVDATHV